MLKALPNLFGRGFAIGFFLPAAIWFAAAMTLAGIPGASDPLAWAKALSAVSDLAVAAGAVWLLAILLMALNRAIYRTYEGYFRHPRQLHDWLVERSKARYQGLVDELADLNDAYTKKALNAEKKRRRAEVNLALVQRFPEKQHILATKFGNVLRAFESYSRIMYGLDDIPGWLRLTAVIPSDFKSGVDDEKALTDFWLNLRFVLVLLTIQAVFMGFDGTAPALLAVGALLLFLPADTVLSWAACNAAVQWGETVKAAYDVYLPALRDKLRLEPPADADEEREQWISFSRAVIYRHRASLPGRTKP